MLYKLFLLFCLYLPFQLALNPVEGVDLASGRVFVLILALLWVISALKNRRIFIPAKIQTALLLSFLFLVSLSLFWAKNASWGGRKLLFLLSIFPIYFVATGLLNKDKNKIIKTTQFLVWGAGLAALIGLFQFALQFIIGLDATTDLWRSYIAPLFLGKSFAQAVLEYSSWLANIGGRDYLRAFSTFPDPHMFSFYLGLTFPLAIGLHFSLKRDSLSLGRNDQKKLNLSSSKIYLMISMIILLANLLTFSRGGYVGLAAGLIFLAGYYAINKKTSLKKLLVSLASLSVVLTILTLTPIGQRFGDSFSFEEGSNKARFENWTQAGDIIKNNLQGVGIGSYAYEIEPSADYRKPIYAHNLYLDIAAESGIISALIFMAIIFFSIKSFMAKSNNNFLYVGGAVSLVVFSVHSIFDSALFSVQVLPLLLIIISLSVLNDEDGKQALN